MTREEVIKYYEEMNKPQNSLYEQFRGQEIARELKNEDSPLSKLIGCNFSLEDMNQESIKRYCNEYFAPHEIFSNNDLIDAIKDYNDPSDIVTLEWY